MCTETKIAQAVHSFRIWVTFVFARDRAVSVNSENFAQIKPESTTHDNERTKLNWCSSIDPAGSEFGNCGVLQSRPKKICFAACTNA